MSIKHNMNTARKHFEITICFSINIEKLPYSIKDFYSYIELLVDTFNQVHVPIMTIAIKETIENEI